MKSFNYDLKEPVEIAVNGKVQQAVALEIFAPNAKVYNEVFVIDAEYARAKKEAEFDSLQLVKGMTPEQVETFIKAGNKKNNKKEPEIKPFDVVAQMLRNGAKINKCFDALKNILTGGTADKPMCRVDSVKMEAPIFDQLSLEDLKEILGRYIESFLDFSRKDLKTS